MKKILITLLFTAFVGLTYSQQRTITLKNFNTWSVTGGLGTNVAKTDVNDGKSQFNTINFKPNYNITISKQLSHFLSFEAAANSGRAATKYDDNDHLTKFMQFEGRIRVNLTNGQFLTNYRNTQLYGYVGAGMINYQVVKDTFESEKDWVHVIPVGVGAKHRLGQRTSFNIDLSYSALNTDNFEGRKVPYSERDGYLRLSLGLQYTFGKKPVLEWDQYTEHFKPSEEHSVDTIVVVKENRNIDTLIIKFVGEPQHSSPSGGGEVIHFDFNKWDIKNNYFDSLDDLALKLLNGDIKTLVLDGFADEVGTDKNNLFVSKQRAMSIKNYLLSKGVNDKKIILNFHGEKNPVSEDKSKNRRVEIKYN